VINAAAIPARYTRDMVFTPWFSGDGAGLPQRRPADYSVRAARITSGLGATSSAAF
jgi:hypothetical protein